ncbi:efflux transporter outer membrane subunit [Paraburkholderia acidiphila]|uniref:Efflux transporter outer membrane subunit n=1 Tax=Paraburkholderia acidiphila TaxID=2571747 RepID=A0A7Z2JBH2_9BURK|nr:efflux transporter outer membrane subunit [Paraburkholderia acidiphila]QGZ56870.1 efflux transporter outer membrane subunit [Paraburkholderia acidiphila]
MFTIYKTRAAIAASLLLAGCAVGPDYRAPAMPVPDHWDQAHETNPAAQPELPQWWMQLNDPLLAALIDEAVVGNLNVATAAAKIREARATYRQAGGALFPKLTGSASATRSGSGSSAVSTATTSSTGSATSDGTGSTISLGTVGNTFQAGFDASWELDLFGANWRALEAAKYGLDAAQWSLRSTLLTLVGDVASYYVQARGYQARLALARNTVKSQEETARLTRVKFESGASSGLDAANAAGQAQTTRATIPTLQTSYAQAVHSLSVLTGQAPEELMGRMEKPEAVPVPKLPVPVGIPADVLLSRPDVRLAERQYAQYTAKVGQAEAARYPSVSLTGSLSTSGTQIGDLGMRSTIGWSFGPSLSIPLFNAGKLKAAVEIAQAQRDQYFIAYRSAVLTALKDVEDASVALSQETGRIDALQASVTSYQQAAILSHSLYAAGSTGFLDVLTADRSLYSAQDSLIQSRVLVTTDYIALNKALGGGWDGEVDTSKPEVVDTHTGPHLRQAVQ